MNYGGNVPASDRVAGAYVGRVLEGERPANLLVQQATRLELIINPENRQGVPPDRAAHHAAWPCREVMQ